jgi:CheY-like chemotaxis protein
MSQDASFILLVEDDDVDELLIRMALTKLNIPHQIRDIHDGAAALDFIANSPTVPALILLDLDLPKVTGLTVLGQIRNDERYHGVPVLIVSSINHPQDIKIAKSMGANAYIYKQELFNILGEELAAVGITPLEK